MMIEGNEKLSIMQGIHLMAEVRLWKCMVVGDEGLWKV